MKIVYCDYCNSIISEKVINNNTYFQLSLTSKQAGLVYNEHYGINDLCEKCKDKIIKLLKENRIK